MLKQTPLNTPTILFCTNIILTGDEPVLYVPVHGRAQTMTPVVHDRGILLAVSEAIEAGDPQPDVEEIGGRRRAGSQPVGG